MWSLCIQYTNTCSWQIKKKKNASHSFAPWDTIPYWASGGQSAIRSTQRRYLSDRQPGEVVLNGLQQTSPGGPCAPVAASHRPGPGLTRLTQPETEEARGPTSALVMEDFSNVPFSPPSFLSGFDKKTIYPNLPWWPSSPNSHFPQNNQSSYADPTVKHKLGCNERMAVGLSVYKMQSVQIPFKKQIPGQFTSEMPTAEKEAELCA